MNLVKSCLSAYFRILVYPKVVENLDTSFNLWSQFPIFYLGVPLILLFCSSVVLWGYEMMLYLCECLENYIGISWIFKKLLYKLKFKKNIQFI